MTALSLALLASGCAAPPVAEPLHPGAGIADSYLSCPDIVSARSFTDFAAYEAAEWAAHSQCRSDLAYVRTALGR